MLFVPRQVALASHAPAAAMAKEESKKDKKSKSKAAKGHAAPDTRAAVVASIASFLESSGFPRTLAALQSEANIEGDAWRSSPVSLEDLVSKFLDSSNSAPGASIAMDKKQDKAEEDVEKKKKKKKSEQEEPSALEKPIENADGEIKEKKQKKKKKNKDSSSAGNDGVSEVNETVKSDDQKLDGKNKESSSGEAAPLDTGKKKKKSKSTSETSEKIGAGTAPAEVEGKSNGANGSIGAAEKVKDDNEKKSKKKRKKSGSEENALVEENQVAGKDSVPKPDEENRGGMDIDKAEDARPSTDNAVVGKKRKLEEVAGTKPPAKEDIAADQKLNNGFAEDDAKEPNTVSKPSKRQKHSSEPKTVIAFQRVKLDGVKFADERLQDNSYWAKGGADSGYGARAQEVLGQVRGRGFRHEKTKKKRGSYRGGQIDLQTHSIKFDNSDEE